MTASTGPGRHQKRILAAACLALFVIFLDNTIVNVALPTIQRVLTTTPERLEWIVNAYIVAFAGLVLLGGKLGDRFGRRWLFVGGLLLFAAASAVGALASSDSILIASRAGQGVGAALLAPLSLALVADAFPRDKLPVAIGLWAGVSGLGLAIGPLVGGLLVEHAGWHAVFWVNVPIALTAAALVAPGLRDARTDRPSRIDVTGALIVTLGLVSTVAALVRAVRHPWTSGLSLGLLVTGSILLAGFVAQQRRSPQPLLPVQAQRDRRFRAAAIVLALVSFALLGTIWFLTIYLQNVAGYSSVAAGVRILPLTVTTLFVAPVAGKVAVRRGQLPVLLAGLLLTLVSLVALTRLQVTTGYGYLAVGLVGLGVGLAMVLPTAVSVVVEDQSAEQVGVASGAATMARQVGGAFGLAVLATVGGRVASDRFHHLVAAPRALDDLVSGGQIQLIGRLAGEPARQAASVAFLSGFTTVMWAAAAAVVLAIPAALSLRRPRTPQATFVPEGRPAGVDRRPLARR